jgi:hypothetical protein
MPFGVTNAPSRDHGPMFETRGVEPHGLLDAIDGVRHLNDAVALRKRLHLFPLK